MRDIKIGLLGLGTIGTGVAKTLLNNKEVLDQRLGFSLVLKKIADLDITTDRGIDIPSDMLTTDVASVIKDPEIDIIVELIGGIKPAKRFIINALRSGKHVVTANKALLASYGEELFDEAKINKRDLYFEAAVGGGIPIIKTLREALISNNYTFIYGILNGTCNYILTEMTENESAFGSALKKAQDLGYAETDPTLDIDGTDSAHKLAIIVSMAYGIRAAMNKIYVEGISEIDPLDIAFAKELGYKVKLLALAIDRGKQVEARVHPTLIPFNYLLSKVDGAFNAVYVRGDIVDSTLYYGRGAGMMPTASAVVGDIADIGRNVQSGIYGRIPSLGYRDNLPMKREIIPIEDITSNYYLRINAIDRPGVLAKISGVLGKRNISIVSVIQKGRKQEGFVPVVILTHEAKESNIKAAIKEIAAFKEVHVRPVVIRVENKDLKDNKNAN
ncbi:MAG: homoserine dehydrogenase [Thermodesulfobacteriota bacterium]|nr:homoserine dehydrogenase [Thermodesulfobacteriota bacterium]